MGSYGNAPRTYVFEMIQVKIFFFDCQVFNDLINSMDSSLNFPYTLYLRSNLVNVCNVQYASDKCSSSICRCRPKYNTANISSWSLKNELTMSGKWLEQL